MHAQLPESISNSRTLSLLEKIGADAIDQIVEQTYHYVLEDTLLNPFFKSSNLDSLLAHQRAFFYLVLGGPDLYQGRSMTNAHAGLELTEAHLTALSTHLTNALRDYAFEDAVIAEVLETLSALKPDILGK